MTTGMVETRRFNSFGWEADGLWRVTTRLVRKRTDCGEREVDIDDREATLVVAIEMNSEVGEWRCQATKLTAVLDLPSTSSENIAFETAPGSDEFVRTGSIALFTDATIFPGGELTTELKLKTGLFSDPDSRPASAVEGVKRFPIKLEYVLTDCGPARTGQRIDTNLLFYVACD